MGGTQPSLLQQRRHEALLDSPIDGARYTVAFKPEHFAEGSCRFAYHGLYCGSGPKEGTKCVVKVSIEGTSSEKSRDYAADMMASAKASELVTLFNDDYVSTKPMRFVLPVMATVIRVDQDPQLMAVVRPGDKVLVEDFIEGKYEKFNNNTSYHSDGVATVPCFSHYTYYKTGGRLLVCDIQGVRTPSGYMLTDPAVHSQRAGQFGATDLGANGMVRFFSSHRCTNVCVGFPISDFQTGRDLPESRVTQTRKHYCLGLLNGPSCECCDGRCGPDNGCNCIDCMRRDLDSFDLSGSRALVNREGAVARLSRGTLKFYCGRENMARDRMTDGFCGPRDGNNCHACRQLDIQARGRYADIVNRWYAQPPAVPTTVLYER